MPHSKNLDFNQSTTRREARQTIDELIISKSIEDSVFRADLISNPRTTLEKLLELKLPSEKTFKVIEETSDEVIIVIPYKNAVDDLTKIETKAKAEGSALKTGHTAIQFTICC